MEAKKLLENGVVTFFSGKKEYRSLSNFWERNVEVGGRIYESGEHCFHGEKYIQIGEQCQDEDRKKILLEYGQTFLKPSMYKTCNVVKKMGGKSGLLLTDSELLLWSSLGVLVQNEICNYKFETYSEVREDLLKSEDKILIHPAMRCSEEKLKGRIWEGRGIVRDGFIVVLGKNKLGNIWMELR
jgi:predicted NAD-dependent protein-ADP-ribosyltransferase YbiA (DUF1768 family)